MTISRSLLACLFLIIASMGAAPAMALFSASTTSSASLGTAVLEPPIDLASSCEPLEVTNIRLTWTPTASTRAEGYEVFRSITAGGPYTQIAIVIGRDTDSYTDTDVQLLTTYYYVTRAIYQSWTSVNSNETSGEAIDICVLSGI